jgi:hypothetical protein
MAIARPAHWADDCRESAKTQLHLNSLSSLAPKLWTILVVVCAMGVTGARVHSEERHHAELRARRPDPALLVPQPASNCEFKRADIKTVDPEEWAHLKVEYERQCYQDAKMAACERLSQLLTLLSGGTEAVAQNPGSSGAASSTIPQAPIGHHQPCGDQVPSKKSQTNPNDISQTNPNDILVEENAILDRKMKSICRGC